MPSSFDKTLDTWNPRRAISEQIDQPFNIIRSDELMKSYNRDFSQSWTPNKLNKSKNYSEEPGIVPK